MFFTRVFRPFQSVRILGFLVVVLGGYLLWLNGWSWWHGYVVVGIGLVSALYVRTLVVDENDRHLETKTGMFPLVNKHVHPAHQLRSIKLTVDRASRREDGPLRRWPIYYSTVHWNSGRWARLMSGRNLRWIEKRTYSVASALGLNVEMTDSYKRYRERVMGKE